MRFTIPSHLTPEWRKHFIRYDALKRMVYAIVEDASDEGSLLDADESSHVRSRQLLEDKFFEELQCQLDGMNSFYSAREETLAHELHERKEEVEVLRATLSNPRTKNSRSTRRRKSSLKNAISEYYYHLTLLQNFQQLNYTGYRKILKKFDKVARSTRGKTYLKETVATSSFYASNRVNLLIEEAERTMIEDLEDGNRSKAMNTLRVPPLDDRGMSSPCTVYFTGLLMGGVALSLVVLTVAAALRPRDSWGENNSAMIRGLRAVFLLALWMFAFAANTYVWRRAGVNNVLIFEFNPRDNLSFVDLFLIGSVIAVVWLIGVYLYVFSYWLGIPDYVGPVVMYALVLGLFLLPVPLYFSSRLWTAKELARIFVPVFPVSFADFWIADQLTSLATIFLDVEFFWCYIFYGLQHPENAVHDCGSVVYVLRVLLAAFPNWCRFAQCINRYVDTREAMPHLVNAGKYSTGFFVVGFSALASGLKDSDAERQSMGYYAAFVLWVVSAVVSSCYSFSWDIRQDWGLFEDKYKLRKELIYPKKIYYSLAIIEDLIFRSLWTLNISVGEAGTKILANDILGTVLACMEVFRRFVWNFFRLENEHLNNCGKFRTVRDIAVYPLDPKELGNQELGAEPPMLENIERQRQMPLVLSDVHLSLVDTARRRLQVHHVQPTVEEVEETEESEI